MIQNITNFYDQAVQISSPGIISYKNYNTQEVFVSYSRNILESIYRNIRDGKYRNTQVCILEIGIPVEQLKVRVSYWIEYYRNWDWKVLNKVHPVKYQIKIEINKYYQVEVILQPSRSKAKVLKVFTNMVDAINYASIQEKKYCKP